MADKLPGWVEALIVKALHEFVPASVIVEAFDRFKTETFAWARAKVALTDNKIDDAVVAKLEEALNACTPDAEFLCDLINRGQDALIDFLRAVAAKTPTVIDDALVDILEEAFKDD